MPVNCKMCGTANDDNVRFCAACGAPQTEHAAAQPVVAAPSTVRAKTMLFNKSPNPSASTAPSSEPAQGLSGRTVLGAPMVQLPGQKSTSRPPAGVSSAPAAATPMVQLNAVKSATPTTPLSTPPAANRSHTVMGLPSANAKEIAAAVEAAKKATARQQAPMATVSVAPPAAVSSQLPKGNTSMEMPKQFATANIPAGATDDRSFAAVTGAPDVSLPPQLETANIPKEASMPPTPAVGTEAPHVQSKLSAPPPKSAPAQSMPKKHAAMEEEWPDSKPVATSKSNSGIIVAIAISALVILGLVGFILFKFVLGSGQRFVPQILPAPDGENLTVILDLPDAAPGATIQLQNQSIPIAGGKVQFLLQKKLMVLGANLVKVMLIEPGKSPEEISFPIMLRHLATNDLTGLMKTPPSIDIHFQVAEGFSIKVNGAPCPLEKGVCTFNLAVDIKQTQKAKSLQYTIPFELLDAEGNSDPGQHIISVPVTEFQIDRPAENAVVASEEVTISGTTIPGAIVSVNGNQITAGDNGFSTIVPLPSLGATNINITAVAPQSAPKTQTVTVTRVDSIQPYVDSWSKDMDPKFDFSKLSRDTATHTGKKIRLTGRIINITSARGITAFLMYVDNGCPQGGQCGVYVAFRGETDAGLQSMVDVYGTVRGTQEVDFAGGAKKTLPAIDAAYVVAVEPDVKRNLKNR